MTADIIIRTAQETDTPVLGRYGTLLMSLHNQWDSDRFIAAEPGTQQVYERWLASQLGRSDVLVMVAERQSSIVGYTYAGMEGNDYMALRGPAGVIHDIFIDQERRNEGIGRKLLEATVEQLAVLGATQIVLSTATQNEPAQRLFTAAGFRPTMIEMTRTLQPGKNAS